MDRLDELGARIWSWRAEHQARTRDDIPRLDRPPRWSPDFSAAAVRGQLDQRDRFAAELAALDPGPLVPDIVDHRLLGSTLARVRWELEVVAAWRCQPRFYVDQAIGPIFDTLLPPGVDDNRVGQVLRHLQAVPRILADGRTNVAGQAVAEFTDIALAELAGIDARLAELAAALAPLAPDRAESLVSACAQAGTALVNYGAWLSAERAGMGHWHPVGPEEYQWFLREVALLPYSTAELSAIGSLELNRAITLEHLSRRRDPAATTTSPRDALAQVEREALQEREVREFYETRDLLGQPNTLGHYLNAPMPAYLEPLRFLGVTDDLTSPARLAEDGVSYVPEPSAELPYFYAANAIDPRAGIVHEGAHYQQLALSWRHDRPLRRHFYDSAPNEGIAFYNEELMLVTGLFDDAPRTRSIIYNFMRLRALRVVVDVGLATGELTIDSAAEYLATQVPMDRQTATEEAAAFAEGPGQAISYQIGKTQILGLVADAVRLGGAGTSVRELHDFLWRNGNVPLALTRWELLGLTDQLEAIGISLFPA